MSERRCIGCLEGRWRLMGRHRHALLSGSGLRLVMRWYTLRRRHSPCRRLRVLVHAFGTRRRHTVRVPLDHIQHIAKRQTSERNTYIVWAPCCHRRRHTRRLPRRRMLSHTRTRHRGRDSNIRSTRWPARTVSILAVSHGPRERGRARRATTRRRAVRARAKTSG